MRTFTRDELFMNWASASLSTNDLAPCWCANPVIPTLGFELVLIGLAGAGLAGLLRTRHRQDI